MIRMNWKKDSGQAQSPESETKMMNHARRMHKRMTQAGRGRAVAMGSFGCDSPFGFRPSGFVYVLACLMLLSPALASAATLRNFSSRHYHIHTDLDASLADDLARRLDAMYEEYGRRLVEFVPREQTRFDVYLFRRQADYAAFVGPHATNTGGVFLPSRGALAAFLENQGRDALRRTLQHEAFHQFAHAALTPNMPVWINEGMAQLFEEGLWTGRGFVLGEVPPRRVRRLQADMAAHRLTPFRDFMSVNLEGWSKTLAADKEAGATQYSQAWAMVHFLVNATDAEGHAVYRTRFIRMLRLLHEGRDGPAAFEEAFSSNIEGFQRRFVEFARALHATPLATLIERQQLLAELILVFQNQGRTFTDMDELRRACADLRFTDADHPDPAMCFMDAEGHVLDASRLFFEGRPQSSMPDIVCRARNRLQIRTRFQRQGTTCEHDTRLETR